MPMFWGRAVISDRGLGNREDQSQIKKGCTRFDKLGEQSKSKSREVNRGEQERSIEELNLDKGQEQHLHLGWAISGRWHAMWRIEENGYSSA